MALFMVNNNCCEDEKYSITLKNKETSLYLLDFEESLKYMNQET